MELFLLFLIRRIVLAGLYLVIETVSPFLSALTNFIKQTYGQVHN